MPGTYTKNFRNLIVDQIKEALDELDPTALYFFIANPLPWPDESSPPDTTDTMVNEYDIRRNFIAMKKINVAETSFVIKRIPWTTNTGFTAYVDNNPDIYNTNYYVVTDEYNVYKCIANNNGISTVKPVGTSTNIVTNADGYRWKFMYTISAADAIKFVSTSHIPVKTLSADDGSIQWTIQSNAANGALQNIRVGTGGSGYLQHAGTVSANNANTRVVALAAGANTIDDIYIGSAIYITGGTGTGQLRTVVDYIGSTRSIVVDANFAPPLNTVNSTYYLSPKVNILGDGDNASAYSIVTGGVVTGINMLTTGTGYSYANATLTANVGTAGTLDPIISPYGGHGKDAIRELGSSSLMFSIQLNQDEGNTISVGNEFRTIGIIANPTLSSNSAVANNLVYDLSTKLVVANTTGSFLPDELIIGQTTGATGYLVDFTANSTVMRLTRTTGNFANAENLAGNSSGATATVSSIAPIPINRYDGEVLYTENRPPISRSSNQKELIKFVIQV